MEVSGEEVEAALKREVSCRCWKLWSVGLQISDYSDAQFCSKEFCAFDGGKGSRICPERFLHPVVQERQ